jgi:hypothetical protein
MSSQTKPTSLLILTKLYPNLLLHLCDFLDAASILEFSLACKESHQLINENEKYWRLRYYKEFALDDDWREVTWLSEFSGQTAPKQPALQPKTLEQKATCDWSYINWRKAYYRRHMFNRRLIYGSWHRRYCDLPAGIKASSLYIMDMHAWATLIGKSNGKRLWIVRHDTAPPGVEPEQLAWRELTLPEDTTFEVLTWKSFTITNNFVFIVYITATIDASNGGNKFFFKDSCAHATIIIWDIRDVSRVIPCYIPYHKAMNNGGHFPKVTYRCGDWILCHIKPDLDSQSDDSIGFASDNQSGDMRHRYSICDLKRKSYYPFGPIYSISTAYIQAATEDYAQVIILYLNSDDMMIKHEDSAVTDDKPAGLRIHWHSYIFDDEHSTSLEDHGGEIIIPYYYDNPLMCGQIYGPGLSLILVCNRNAPNPGSPGYGTEPHAMLALVRVPDHSLPQNSISHRRRSRYGGAIGEVIWIQPIAGSHVHPLYSQNLIVVKHGKIDILSGTDGRIVRQFSDNHDILVPIIWPYYCSQGYGGDIFILNIETKKTFQHSKYLQPPMSILRTADRLNVISSLIWFYGEPIIPGGWPFYNCIGQLVKHKSEHRERLLLYRKKRIARFYLYSLSAF